MDDHLSLYSAHLAIFYKPDILLVYFAIIPMSVIRATKNEFRLLNVRFQYPKGLPAENVLCCQKLPKFQHYQILSLQLAQFR